MPGTARVLRDRHRRHQPDVDVLPVRRRVTESVLLTLGDLPS